VFFALFGCFFSRCGCQTYFQLVCDYKSVSGESWCVQTLNGVTPLLCQKGVVRGSGCHTHTDIYDAYLRDTFQYKYKQWAGNVGPNTFSKHYTHRVCVLCVCVSAKCACNCKFNELFTFLCACWPRPRPLVLAMLFTWISRWMFFFLQRCFAADFIYNSCAKLN